MKYWLPSNIYDVIKFIVTVVLPAATAAYVGLAATWGWPMANEVERTLVIFYTFFCAVMGISTYTAKPIDEVTKPIDENGKE